MPITTPETEQQFRVYGSALEVKGAAKASLAALEDARDLGRDMEAELRGKLEDAIRVVRRLLESATEDVARLRPTRIEDRGYSAHDREVGAFSKGCGCASDCAGGCGKCGGSTP